MADSTIRFVTAFALAALPCAALAQTDAPKPPPPAQSSAPPPKKTVDTVVVTAGQPDVTTSIDRKSFTLGKDLQATSGSIADALRNVPSVEVDLQGNLSLRGDANVTILVDGKPAPQFEGKGRADALQQLPADQYERVEVITNPSAALNPEGTGGVINLISKTSRGSGFTGSAYVTAATAGLKREGVTLGYNSPKLSVTAALSGNYQRNKNHGHDFRSGLDPVTGGFDDTGNDFIGRNLTRSPSARLSLSYSATPKDQLTANLQLSQLLVEGHPFNRYFDFAGGAEVDNLVRQGSRRFIEGDTGLTAGWKHTFGEAHDLSVDLVRNESDGRDHTLEQTFFQQPVVIAPFERTLDDENFGHTELRVGYDRPLPAGATLKAGYELKHDQDINDHRDEQGAAPSGLTTVAALENDYTYRQTINAAFATYEKPFGDITLLAGLRVEDTGWTLDQHTEQRTVRQAYTRFFPTLHLAWKLDDEDKLTASLSERINRPPDFFLNPKLYLFDPKNIGQGNPDLKPTVTDAWELGYEHRQGDTSLISTLYYRPSKDGASSVLLDLGNGVFEQTFENLGKVLSTGLETTLTGKLTKTLSYNVTVNLYWTQIGGQTIEQAHDFSAWGVNGRANLDWQIRPDDLVQLNAIGYGRRLGAQGASLPFTVWNFGWRHKVDDRMSLTLTAQDLTAATRFGRTLTSPILIEHFEGRPRVRAVSLRLDYRFGGKAKGVKEPAFDYDTQSGGGGGGRGPC